MSDRIMGSSTAANYCSSCGVIYGTSHVCTNAPRSTSAPKVMVQGTAKVDWGSVAADCAEERRQLRAALIRIARWNGPGNRMDRVYACEALGVDPRERHDWDYGPPPDFASPSVAPDEEAATHTAQDGTPHL